MINVCIPWRPQLSCVVRLLMLCLSLTVTQLEAAEKSYSFGIVPQQSATKLARTWIPLLQLLQQKTGISLRFATAPDIPTFEKRLARGKYDFAYMNPYHYTVFHESPGYLAFARQANKLIKGILVVRKDSPYQSVEDLDGQVFAFPAPAAFAATLLVISYLQKMGVHYTAKFVSSHDSVYRAVTGGYVSSGGGIMRTLESVAPQVREQLRVLWESRGYTPHAFAVHPRIPVNTVTLIQQAMLELSEEPSGIAVLEKININKIEKAENHFWDDVRGLNIDSLKMAN